MAVKRVENLNVPFLRALGMEVAEGLGLDKPSLFNSQQWDRYGNAKANGVSDNTIKDQFDRENAKKK